MAGQWPGHTDAKAVLQSTRVGKLQIGGSGIPLHCNVGAALGIDVGLKEGLAVGRCDGLAVGLAVGGCVGLEVGIAVGILLGAAVGSSVLKDKKASLLR